MYHRQQFGKRLRRASVRASCSSSSSAIASTGASARAGEGKHNNWLALFACLFFFLFRKRCGGKKEFLYAKFCSFLAFACLSCLDLDLG